MPELPEVECARRALERWFDGRRLTRVEVERAARTLRDTRPADVVRLAPATLVSTARRGKYLLLGFSGGRGLVAHLGLTGKFLKRPAGEAVGHSRARFLLDSGDVIHFSDPRLFGRLVAAPAAKLDEYPPVANLGLDPLVDGLTGPRLQQAIGATKQPLKVAMMDQARVAGLGNIHVAEALYRARLHPSRTAASLSKAEWAALARAIDAGIRFALAREGALDEISYVEEPGAPNPFLVYGRAGEHCRRCRATFAVFTQGGRSTYYCPGCQRVAAATTSKRPPKPSTRKRTAR